MVATYAYVNPVIAVLLGWGIAGESLTGQMVLGAAFIVASVVLVTLQNGSAASDETEVPDTAATPPFRAGEKQRAASASA
jgi:hypothetical protein